MTGYHADLTGCNQVRATLLAASPDNEHTLTAEQLADGVLGSTAMCQGRNALESGQARHHRWEPLLGQRRGAQLVHRCDLRLPRRGRSHVGELPDRLQAAGVLWWREGQL